MLLGNRERGDSLVELALIKIGPGSEQLRFCTNIVERRGQLDGSRFSDISLNLAKILSPFLELARAAAKMGALGSAAQAAE